MFKYLNFIPGSAAHPSFLLIWTRMGSMQFLMDRTPSTQVGDPDGIPSSQDQALLGNGQQMGTLCFGLSPLSPWHSDDLKG